MSAALAIAEVAPVAVGELWTLEDLARLWKPVGKDEMARRAWLWRRIHAWQIPNCGDRRDPRFLPAEVMRAVERNVGRRARR